MFTVDALAQTRQSIGSAFPEKPPKGEKRPVVKKPAPKKAVPAPSAGEWSPEDRKRLMDEVTAGFYADGIKAKKAGKLDEALPLFERVVLLDPKNEAAKGQVADIKKRLAAAKKSQPSAKTATSKLLTKLWSEADAATKAKNWEVAQLALKKILAIEPANKRARARLDTAEQNLFARLKARGEDREKSGNTAGAIEAYKLALSHGKDPVLAAKVERLRAQLGETNRKKSDDLYIEALGASQQGNSDKALTLCRQALRLNPTNLQAQRMLERLESRVR